MFKDKELRKMLFGFFCTQETGYPSRTLTFSSDKDGINEEVETAQGLVFHLLKKIKNLEDKVAGLEMLQASAKYACDSDSWQQGKKKSKR